MAAFGAAALVLCLLGVALYPVDLASQSSPDFIDAIFANRLVILAARLLLVAAAAVLALGGAFISLSIGFRISNGEWLRRAGPFEISARADETARSQPSLWGDLAQQDRAEIARLRAQLGDAEELIRDLQLRRDHD
jgi:hypothetical protein